MKKQILNLGKSLNKGEQKTINGGVIYCGDGKSCPSTHCCNPRGYCVTDERGRDCSQSYYPGLD